MWNKNSIIISTVIKGREQQASLQTRFQLLFIIVLILCVENLRV